MNNAAFCIFRRIYVNLFRKLLALLCTQRLFSKNQSTQFYDATKHFAKNKRQTYNKTRILVGIHLCTLLICFSFKRIRIYNIFSISVVNRRSNHIFILKFRDWTDEKKNFLEIDNKMDKFLNLLSIIKWNTKKKKCDFFSPLGTNTMKLNFLRHKRIDVPTANNSIESNNVFTLVLVFIVEWRKENGVDASEWQRLTSVSERHVQ